MPALQDESTILAALQQGKISLQGQFLNSSNYTFLCRVEDKTLAVEAVYKPRRGERALWDFPPGSLTRREVAAYLVSGALGWQLVPPTVFRRQKTPLGAGSLQAFIDHNPEYHYFRFTPQERQRLRPVVVFDLLVNNADRKGGHILIDAQDHLWLIDHGVCFHVEPKLRTVVWDFAGEPIPKDLLHDVRRLHEALQSETTLRGELVSLLKPPEVDAVARRAASLLSQARFPNPGSDHRPYPYPPV